MKEHIDLIMGLVAGLALTFLNNDAVHDSISLSLIHIFLKVNIKPKWKGLNFHHLMCRYLKVIQIIKI